MENNFCKITGINTRNLTKFFLPHGYSLKRKITKKQKNIPISNLRTALLYKKTSAGSDNRGRVEVINTVHLDL